MAPQRFAFGPFVLDADNSALFESGLPIAIGSKSLALLLTLVQARGQVVRKPALMDAAWPHANVEESNLTVQIAALRRRLRVSTDGPEWIATFPRVGYRFAGPLTVLQAEEPFAGVGRMIEASPSIAVMPFADLGSDPEQIHFADGLVDDLIADLSKVPGLAVIARHSSFSFKEKPGNTQVIANDLNVQYVVEGSVRRLAGRVRISVRLTETSINRCLWAQRFDGYAADLFDLPDLVVRKIVSALSNVLPLGAVVSIPPRRWTTIEAHDFLVRGRVLVMHSPAGNGLARDFLLKASELDPDLSEAYAWLAVSHYGAAIHYGEDVDANRALGLAYAQKANSIDTADPMPHSVLG